METTTETPAATEETTTVETTVETPRADPPDQNIIGEAKRKQKQAEKQAADLLKRLEELEDRDKSETERERKAREKAEARAQELEGKVQSMEKGGWLRSAAAAAGFEDPSDAEAFIALQDIDTEAEAQKAVKDLAKRKPKLLKDTDPTPPQIGRVAPDGTVQPAGRTSTDPARVRKEQEADAVMDAIKKARGQ